MNLWWKGGRCEARHVNEWAGGPFSSYVVSYVVPTPPALSTVERYAMMDEVQYMGVRSEQASQWIKIQQTTKHGSVRDELFIVWSIAATSNIPPSFTVSPHLHTTEEQQGPRTSAQRCSLVCITPAVQRGRQGRIRSVLGGKSGQETTTAT